MDRQFQISICIPTYNFGPFIGQTLDSILDQRPSDVEIVVFDGGSSDSTPDIVRDRQKQYPYIRYERQEFRGGIDRDMARAVSLASGKYCWLFGADDLLRKGALAEMLSWVKEDRDVFLCGLTLCTKTMTPFREHPILRPGNQTCFDLANPQDRKIYFERAQTTTAFFSFLGSLVFRTERWNSLPLDEDFVGSYWAHVARFFRMMPLGLRLRYIESSYILKRVDNDSFMEQGLPHRYWKTVDGYKRLATVFFGADSMEYKHVIRALRNEFPPRVLLATKMQCAPEDLQGLETLGRIAETLYGGPEFANRLRWVLYRYCPLPHGLFSLYRAARLAKRDIEGRLYKSPKQHEKN